MTSDSFSCFYLNYAFRSIRTLLAIGLAYFVVAASCADAAIFNVDRIDDDDAAVNCADGAARDCSLRGAILKANGLTEASTISVPAGTYILSKASVCTYRIQGNPHFFSESQIPLCVAKKITINGAGAAATIIDGNALDRVLFVSADAVAQISGVTIRNGALASFSFGVVGGGGGVNNQGALTLIDSAVMDNTADRGSGGGIYNAGTLTLQRSNVSRNTRLDNAGDGGGIGNQSTPSSLLKATLIISDSTISDNVTRNNGGGIFNFGGTVTVTNSTLSQNTVGTLGGGSGGGIANFGFNLDGVLFTGTLTVTNSTISGNRSAGQGGGIFAQASFAHTHLQNATITNNVSKSAGGVIGALTFQNTLIAGNVAGNGPDCFATAQTALTSLGHNLIQDVTTCQITGDLTGNITGRSPRLGLLTQNGGPTKTHALIEGSPAIDAGSSAKPGSAGNACAVNDQRGFLRPLGATCDIGAFERGSAFSLTEILPNAGGNIGSVSAIVSGNGFSNGAIFKLTRAGQADVIGNPAQVDAGSSATSVTFDLAGKSIGQWDVVVRNSDGVTKTLSRGFTIEQGRAPELWVDVIGRTLRPARLSRITIYYGNRGNVDAVGVPLLITIPKDYPSRRYFSITPPPSQPGQTREDWRQVPVTVGVLGEVSQFIQVPLLLPVVPAGYTGTLQIGLTLPLSVPNSFLLTSIGTPILGPGLNGEAVTGAVAGARTYLRNLGVTVSPALEPDLEKYANRQLQQVIESGRTAFVTSLGTQPQVYSLSQLQLDLALYGAARVASGTRVSPTSAAPSEWFLGGFRAVDFLGRAAMENAKLLYGALEALLTWIGPREAQAQEQNCPVFKKGDVLTPGCSGGGGPDEPFLPPEIPLPPGCNLKDPTTFKNCKPTPDHCDALPGYKIVRAANGESFCVPSKPGKNCSKLAANPVGSNEGCSIFPLRSKNSYDPNDKVGSMGASDAHFLLGSTPLSYTVFFENLQTATAAAQEVVITDQLDVRTMDLDTFSLGPISFSGGTTLIPAPGAKQYSGGVDLRPKQNLIVAITAGLDKSTGLLTWRFASIDPKTGQFTNDSDAGFLPPNVNAPEGEGSVTFTVKPKLRLATGTTICNQASIVFDVNAPIATPLWCNTSDNVPPTSQVLALAATQAYPSFLLKWSGTDQGSNVQDYSIFVSENNGAFTSFLSSTQKTSTTFIGQPGKSYRFYSVASDKAGNVEDPPQIADAATKVDVGQIILGDLNGDRKVDCVDLTVIKAAFGKRTGQPGFDLRADVNNDGVVDIRDLTFVSQRLPVGTRCP